MPLCPWSIISGYPPAHILSGFVCIYIISINVSIVPSTNIYSLLSCICLFLLSNTGLHMFLLSNVGQNGTPNKSIWLCNLA